MSDTTRVVVLIDQDYLRLGPAATQRDLDRYTQYLAEHLAAMARRAVRP